MSLKSVGKWLQSNAGSGLALVGSLMTGNLPAAIAAGSAMVASATGTTDAAEMLARLQNDPATVIRLKEIAAQEDASIRSHIEAMARMELEDAQNEHQTQQKTIQIGDTADDEYVRRTRPLMARRSFWAATGYVVALEMLHAFDVGDGASFELAGVLLAPAAAYMGFRTWDKHHKSRAVAAIAGSKK